MTSFNSTDPVTTTTPASTDPSSFVDPNANPTAASDTGVVEYKGRKLTAAEVAKQLERLDAKDDFIAQLKAERAQDRAQVQELLAALKKGTSADELLRAQASAAAAPPPAALDPDALITAAVERIDSRNAAALAEAAAKANFAHVSTTLTKQYGQDTDAKVREVCASNGLSLEEGVALARDKPAVFLALFPKAQAPNPTYRGTRNPLAVEGQPSTGRRADSANIFKATTTRDQVAIYRQRLAEAQQSN